MPAWCYEIDFDSMWAQHKTVNLQLWNSKKSKKKNLVDSPWLEDTDHAFSESVHSLPILSPSENDSYAIMQLLLSDAFRL